MSSTAEIVSASLLRTTGIDGDVRTWGMCETCGHVEELAQRRIAHWVNSRQCETCADDAFDAAVEASRMRVFGAGDDHEKA